MLFRFKEKIHKVSVLKFSFFLRVQIFNSTGTFFVDFFAVNSAADMLNSNTCV